MPRRAIWGWDPWRELRRFENVMDSVFSNVLTGGEFPAVNIVSSGEDAIIRAEIPGVEPSDIDISVKGKTLTIRGSRKPEETGEEETFHRRERWQGSFTRSVELPFTVESDKVEAKFKNGVLTVTVPRAEAEKPRKIAVSYN